MGLPSEGTFGPIEARYRELFHSIFLGLQGIFSRFTEYSGSRRSKAREQPKIVKFIRYQVH